MANLVGNILGIEGTGQNQRSSAAGPGQFLSSTWLDMINRYHPEMAQSMSPQQILALRTDPNYAGLGREMTGAYARENQGVLAAVGQATTPGNTYLAHFAGPGGAVKLLTSDPATPVAQVLGPNVVNANPFLANMTAADAIKWADRKMANADPTVSAPGPQFAAGDSPALGTPASASYNLPSTPSPENAPASAPAPQGAGLGSAIARALGIPVDPNVQKALTNFGKTAGDQTTAPSQASFLTPQQPLAIQFAGRPPVQLAPGPYLPAPALKPGFYQGGLGSSAYGGIRG